MMAAYSAVMAENMYISRKEMSKEVFGMGGFSVDLEELLVVHITP